MCGFKVTHHREATFGVQLTAFAPGREPASPASVFEWWAAGHRCQKLAVGTLWDDMGFLDTREESQHYGGTLAGPTST